MTKISAFEIDPSVSMDDLEARKELRLVTRMIRNCICDKHPSIIPYAKHLGDYARRIRNKHKIYECF